MSVWWEGGSRCLGWVFFFRGGGGWVEKGGSSRFFSMEGGGIKEFVICLRIKGSLAQTEM